MCVLLLPGEVYNRFNSLTSFVVYKGLTSLVSLRNVVWHCVRVKICHDFDLSISFWFHWFCFMFWKLWRQLCSCLGFVCLLDEWTILSLWRFLFIPAKTFYSKFYLFHIKIANIALNQTFTLSLLVCSYLSLFFDYIHNEPKMLLFYKKTRYILYGCLHFSLHYLNNMNFLHFIYDVEVTYV
jgi:hypothetical protein